MHHTERPFTEIPVSNNIKHDVTLTSRTALGSIRPIARIVQTDQTDSVHVNEVDSPSSISGDDKSSPTTLWPPPVDISHKGDEQQVVVKQMLYEEFNAFAHNGNDIGCIPSL